MTETEHLTNLIKKNIEIINNQVFYGGVGLLHDYETALYLIQQNGNDLEELRELLGQTETTLLTLID